MAPSLQTRWEVQQIAGEPIAVIRARQLQYTIQGPQDAWGRQGRPQPLLVSAEVSLTQPFGSSSSKDVVASDTVHYGLLSKAILATLGRLEKTAEARSMSLHGLLESIWSDLTGLGFDGSDADLAGRKAFLSLQYVRSLTVTVDLPKATLLGGGVSLSATSVLETASSKTTAKATAMTLNLKGLRIPTLIGVNDNERIAKQVVVANIGIDKYYSQQDAYAPLEAIVVEVSAHGSSVRQRTCTEQVYSSCPTRHMKPSRLWRVT